MPVISMFYGILVYMYFFDNKQHKMPHIHAKYQDEESIFNILTGEILEGNLRPAKVKLVQAWIEIHRDELIADWELASKGEAIFKIDPLKQAKMNPRVAEVKPRKDFTLEILFTNQEKKIFDVKPYMDKGIFKELNKSEIFNSVKVENGTISWPGGQDFCPDTLYVDGTKVHQDQPHYPNKHH